MAEWRHTTWGEVITLQRGYDITKKEQALNGSVPVVSSGGISSYHDRAINDGPGVIIGRKGTLGRVHFVDGPFWPHDTTLWVRDFKGNDPRFVFYALKTFDPEFLNVGSASPTLNRNHLHPLPVYWPAKLEDQQAIAKALGALDDKIAANDRLVGIVDEYLGCEFTLLSAGAELGSLRDIAAVSASITRPVIGGHLRYLDISAVSAGSYSLPSVIKWEQAPGRARRAVKVGDTVWSTVRPNRRSHALILDDDSLLVGSTGLAVISPKKGRIACTYESSRREEFVQYLEGVAEGSAYPAVRADRFNEAPVPALRDEQWDHFESIALPLRKRSHAATVENRWLAATRDELLPLLMSGKIRVREAEKIVEGVV